MKSNEFGTFLVNYSHVLSACGANENSTAWQSLAMIFGIRPSGNVKDICKQFAMGDKSYGSGPRIDVIVRELSAIMRWLNPIAKKALIDDLNAVRVALEPLGRYSLSGLVSATSARLQAQAAKPARSRSSGAINAQVVERHLRSLEDAFGDETAFRKAYEDLTSDVSVKLPEAKRLAKEFAKASAASKGKALKLIWGRHASLMESRAKAAATGGRTAA